MRFARLVAATLSLLLSPLLLAQPAYTTSFEAPEYMLGDVAGQNGWGHESNSPTRGEIVAAPAGGFGSQSLAIKTRNVDFFGVASHLYSPVISPAGESGSTVGGVVVPSPNSTFQASFWYRTPSTAPISFYADGRIAELDPSERSTAQGSVGNRYTQVRVINTTNNASGLPRVQMRWYLSSGLTSTNVATLEWGQWYRFEYIIQLVDGQAGNEANDRFRLNIYDSGNTLVGTACGSTWELAWKSGSFGGTATARAINGFDFWSLINTNGAIAGHIDQFSISSSTPANAALQATIAGNANVCSGGLSSLTVSTSGGHGPAGTIIWRDGSNAVVGGGPTLNAPAGTYTATVTDAWCETATSAPFQVTAYAPLTASISGNTSVCFGGTTTLTASASGGSGTISGYTWRDGANAIVGTGTTLVAGAGTYTVTATDASCGSAISAPVTVEVTCKATPVVTWNDPADITYGTPLGAAQLNATASVPGTFVYTPPAGAILNAGPHQLLSVDFTPADSANYNSVNGTTVHINVLPATPVVTVTGGPFVYDGAAHVATATARNASGGTVSGTMTLTYNGSSAAPVNAGSYAVVATFTSSDPNYTNATGNGTLVIDRATPVITWPTPADITYGTRLGPAQLNATANVPGTFTYTPPAGTRLNAGAGHQLSVDFVPTDTVNYAPVSTTVLITVRRAPTTITITSITPEPSARGQLITVRYTIGGLFGGTNGTVTVTDDVDLCSSAAAGQSCTFALRTVGTRSIYAVFIGDSNHLGSTSPSVPHQVTASTATSTAALEGATPGGATICNGSSATLTVRLTGTAPWTLTWSDGVTQTTSNAVHTRTVTPAQTTTYTITSVSDATGPGTATGTATINVTTVPPPSISSDVSPQVGRPATLRASAGYTSYQWYLNGTAIPGATSMEYTIASVTQADLGVYTVTGTRDGCVSAQSSAYTLVPLALPLDFDAVIPVVGNARGASGSNFRTTLHLVNPSDGVAEGEITFITPQLPKYSYRLAPRESRFIDDLLPSSFEGLTSANVRRLLGPLPVVVAHVFNDAAALGTSGLIQRLVPVDEALGAGDRAVLVTPNNGVTTRFNLGIRSLDEGLTVRVERRTAQGILLTSSIRVVPPSTLIHEPLAPQADAAAPRSESLTFEVLAGRGVIYGAATDNGTNDPNMQLASRIAAAGSGRYVLPVAGAIDGLFGSRFATGLQMHNPTDQPMVIRLTFRPASGVEPGAPLSVNVPARATVAYDDVVATLGGSGLGSLDVVTTSPIRPLLLARVYSIAAAGQTSLMTELVLEEDALRAGEEGIIAASHAPRSARFSVGLRTLAAGARITATVRRPNGVLARVTTLSFGPNTFLQDAAAALLGFDFTGDESVTFVVNEGSAVIYGVWTDNVTQDPALQYAVSR